MDKIGIACFTKRGAALADSLAWEYRGRYEILRYEKNLRQWCRDCFEQAEGIIFIGACGIAVRTVAPFLKSKTTDPAVVVIDEAGQYVISLLSGHIGGANEFAVDIAQRIGATPVITTASDVNGKLAVDVFAKKNGLAIGSMHDAKEIAAAILRGERVGVYCTGNIEGAIPQELTLLPVRGADAASMTEQERTVLAVCDGRNTDAAGLTDQGRNVLLSDSGRNTDAAELPDQGRDTLLLFDSVQKAVDHIIWISEQSPQRALAAEYLTRADGTVLHLIPKAVVLGLGCRRGKEETELKSTVDRVLAKAGIPASALCCASSIDLKKDEGGIHALCRTLGILFETWTADELSAVQGDFQASEFVRRTTGVDNVCERAALLAAGTGGRLISRKYAENGVTAALAVREWRVRFEK